VQSTPLSTVYIQFKNFDHTSAGRARANRVAASGARHDLSDAEAKKSGTSSQLRRTILSQHRDLSHNLPERSPQPSATMSMHCRYAASRCARQLRSVVVRPVVSSHAAAARIPSRRYESTDAAAPAVPENPKIAAIVDEISKLTLLETADLVSSLKVSYQRCTFYANSIPPHPARPPTNQHPIHTAIE
jgi:ribosomal L7/L12-like protein